MIKQVFFPVLNRGVTYNISFEKRAKKVENPNVIHQEKNEHVNLDVKFSNSDDRNKIFESLPISPLFAKKHMIQNIVI